MYRTSYRRSGGTGLAWLGIITGIVVAVVVPATALMWIVKIVHDWWSFVPAMGFGTALAITLVSTGSALILKGIIALFGGSK